MSAAGTDLDRRLAQLRADFDDAFAAPVPEAADEPESFLAIRVGDDPLALRLRDLAGLHPRRRVVALPGAAPDLLGITSVRARLVPVFGLAPLLGSPPEQDWRWIALAAGGAALGLAFGHFEGYLLAPRGSVLPARHATRDRVPDLLTLGGVTRGVVSVSSLVALLRQRVDSHSPG